MKVATIVPTAYLDLVMDDVYHLCLLHRIRVDTIYRNFYKQMADEGKFVILDCGAAEGERSTISDIYEWALAIGASEIQLPDVYQDKETTLKSSYEGLEYLRKQGYKGKIMAVPQGVTLLRWTECLEEMFTWGDEITTIGVPKNLCHAGPYQRGWAIQHLLMDYALIRPNDFDIHLLGCWDNPTEIGTLAMKYPEIRGVDSGIATIYTQHDLVLDSSRDTKPQEGVDFDNKTMSRGLLELNIERWREYVHGVR